MVVFDENAQEDAFSAAYPIRVCLCRRDELRNSWTFLSANV